MGDFMSNFEQTSPKNIVNKSIEKNYEILDIERNRTSIDFSIDNSKT